MAIRSSQKRKSVAGGWSQLNSYRSTLDAGMTGVNYWGNGSDGSTTILTNTTWDSTSSGDMIVKNFVNLTIYSGTTLTIKARKGALIYVSGNFVNNGTIVVQSAYSADPSVEGVPSTGLRIIRRKAGATDTLSASDLAGCGAAAIASEVAQAAITGNGKIYTIPRTGGAGGANAPSGYANGYAGGDGSTAKTLGGGASGGGGYATVSGAGAAATCWSGGAGGGGSASATGSAAGVNATANGGAGGGGGSGGGYGGGGGGAGNPGGAGAASGGTTGESKVGGMAVLLVKGSFNNTGTISADGGLGGAGAYGGAGNGSGGGGAGGGAILVLYGGALTSAGTMHATGGTGGTAGSGSTTQQVGGPGGAGFVTLEQVDI